MRYDITKRVSRILDKFYPYGYAVIFGYRRCLSGGVGSDSHVHLSYFSYVRIYNETLITTHLQVEKCIREPVVRFRKYGTSRLVTKHYLYYIKKNQFELIIFYVNCINNNHVNK